MPCANTEFDFLRTVKCVPYSSCIRFNNVWNEFIWGCNEYMKCLRPLDTVILLGSPLSAYT